MSAGAIGGSNGLATSEAASAGSFGDISTEEFVNILVAELTQQDPFNPNDSAAILEQLNSLREIESSLSLQQNLEALVTQNALTSATGFIGKFVTGIDANNQAVEGIASSLSIENGEAILRLEGGGSVAASNVTDVQDLGDLDTQVVQQLLSSLLVLDAQQLIGKHVSGPDRQGAFQDGLVTGIRREPDDIYLELDTGQTLPVGNVTRFMDSEG